MNDEKIDWESLKQYQKIFGTDKMQMLWQEFLHNTLEDIADIEDKDLQTIRLKFHSWRSSSQVFGLKGFSRECEAIEEMAISCENIEKIKKTIDNCKKTFHNTQKEVDRFFGQGKNGTDANRK